MADPIHLRISDADDPDRGAKFTEALKPNAASANGVIRQLIDAYNRYVDEHGRGPVFPVDLVTRPPKKKPSGK